MGKKKEERFQFTEEQKTIPAPCPVFGSCGGCRYQDIEYPLQVEAKANWLSKLFGRPVEVIASPVFYGYRNRMDFVYAFGKLGLRQAGSYQWVVDIERCELMSEPANRLLTRVRELLSHHSIPCYNYISHEGYLRYAVFRSTSLKETLVNFITVNESAEIEAVINNLIPETTALCWSIHDGLADLSFGGIHKTFGANTIREKIGNSSFQIGPNTFFQNNPYLIGQVIEDLNPFVQGRVLDLYCGVGCLGICVANRADSILGIEEIEDSILLAKENACLNSISNIEFESAKVRPWLNEWVQQKKGDFDTVIVDPPREGLSPKVVRNLLRLAPERIAYISCNPKLLSEELELFQEDYNLGYLKGYDLFPQTPHVEVLALLQRKNK